MNYDFITEQPWTDSSVPDDWTKGYTHDASNYVEENTNGCRFVSDGTLMGIHYAGAFTIGNTYKVTIDVYSITSGRLKVGDQYDEELEVSSTGISSVTFTAATENLTIARDIACDIIVKSIKVEE